MANPNGEPAQFTPDEWVKVRTLSADRALRFFEKPQDWPVRRVPRSKDECDGTWIFEVKAS